MKKSGFFKAIVCAYLCFVPGAYASSGEPSMFKFVFGIVNFLIFGYIIYRFGFSKIALFFRSRGEQVARDIDGAQREKTEALEAFDSSRERLKKVAGEVEEIIEDAKGRGNKLKNMIVGSAKSRADTLLKDGELLALRESRKAQAYLKKALMDMSISLAEEKIKKKLKTKEHGKLIDGCIKQLEGL